MRLPRSYAMAETLNRHLEEMGTTLNNLVERVNKTQQTDEQDNPVRARVWTHSARGPPLLTQARRRVVVRAGRSPHP